MKYINVNDGTVTEIIPEIDSHFLGVPFNKRFAKDFTEKCIAVDDDFIVSVGMVYKDGVFTIPPEPIIESSTTPLSEAELLKAQNKALSDRLEFTEDLIAEMAMKVYAE